MARSTTPRLGPVIPIPQEIRPDPDPTVLTTQQLIREISTFREIVDARLMTVHDVITTRIDAMDRAVGLLQQQTDRGPENMLAVVRQLQALHEEKFSSIQTQFTEKDTRAEQTSRDSKVAVAAALQAAKEAVGEQNISNALAISKSETMFTNQIKGIGDLVVTMQKAIDDKIDDIKARLQSTDNRIQSIESQKKGQGDSLHVWFGVISLIIAVASVATAALSIMFNRSH